MKLREEFPSAWVYKRPPERFLLPGISAVPVTERTNLPARSVKHKRCLYTRTNNNNVAVVFHVMPQISEHNTLTWRYLREIDRQHTLSFAAIDTACSTGFFHHHRTYSGTTGLT